MAEKERVFGNEYRTTVICVDSYANGEPKGSFYNPYMAEAQSFRSLTQLLLGMEDTLNEMKLPQLFNAVRTFANTPPPDAAAAGAAPQNGALATFAVKVLFRQNASWQGSVVWTEGRAEESFRSVLELICLMDSALKAS